MAMVAGCTTKIMQSPLQGTASTQKYSSKAWTLTIFALSHPKLTIEAHIMSIATDYTRKITYTLLCGTTAGKNFPKCRSSLICKNVTLSHFKLIIQTDVMSMAADCTTKIMHPPLHDTAMVHKHSSKVWILMDPEDFCTGCPKFSIKSHALSKASVWTTKIMDPLLYGATTV